MKELLTKLVSFKTFQPDEINRAMDWIEDFLKKSGVPVKKLTNEGLSMLVATIGDPKAKKLVLNAHIEVVANPPEYFNLREDKDRLIGPGVLDMKGAAVVYMMLLKELKGEKLPIGVEVQFVPDEEVGGLFGTAYLVKNGYLGDFVICGEPTHLNISIQSKGRIYFEANVPGRISHSARPWEGENAIFRAYEFYNEISRASFMRAKNEFFTIPSLAMTKISAGKATNQVPDECLIGIDFRYLPEQDANKILEEIKKIAAGFKAEIEVKSTSDPICATKNNPWVKNIFSIAKKHRKDAKLIGQHGSADGRFFTPLGIEAIEFGPSGGNQHAANEYINYPSLLSYKEIMEELILTRLPL